MPEKNIVPILDKALDIVEYISAAPDAVSQPELQKSLGIPQATCYRIVKTLVERGWLDRRGNRQFDISTRLAGLACKTGIRMEKYRKLQPLMNRIVEKAGYSAKFSVRDDQDIVNVCASRNHSESVMFSDAGFRTPLDKIASVSSIFLAEERESEQKRLVGPGQWEKLSGNLAFYRSRGYTFQAGIAAADAEYPFDTLSLPVRRGEKLVGVLSFLSLPGVLSREKDHVVSRIKDCLPELSEKAGC